MSKFLDHLFGFLVTMGLYAIEGGIVMLAWNASVPLLFGLPQATWPAGVGLVFLANATVRRSRPIDKPSR